MNDNFRVKIGIDIEHEELRQELMKIIHDEYPDARLGLIASGDPNVILIPLILQSASVVIGIIQLIVSIQNDNKNAQIHFEISSPIGEHIVIDAKDSKTIIEILNNLKKDS